MIHQSRNAGWVFLCFATAVGLCGPEAGRAQENTRFIAVEGTGVVTKAPNLAQIRMSIVATGETTKSATKEFKKARQLFLDKMGPMNFPEVELKFQRPKVQSGEASNMAQMMNDAFDNIGEAASSDQFECREIVILETEVDEDPIKMLDQVSKIIDASINAKATLANNSMEMIYQGYSSAEVLSLSRSDLDQMKKESNRLAFEDAKKQAEALAELSGGKIGKVLQITGSIPDEYPSFGFSSENETDDGAQVEVTTHLSIRFELKD